MISILRQKKCVYFLKTHFENHDISSFFIKTSLSVTAQGVDISNLYIGV